MSLKKQIQSYSLTGVAFYTQKEFETERKKTELISEIQELSKEINSLIIDINSTKENKRGLRNGGYAENKNEIKELLCEEKNMVEYKRCLNAEKKQKVKELESYSDKMFDLVADTSFIRVLNWDNYLNKKGDSEIQYKDGSIKIFKESDRLNYIKLKKTISLFETSLVRALDCKINEITEEIITIKCGYEDLFKSLVINGFMYKDEKYILYSSSAGQLRNRKALFIKEASWKRVEMKVMCGLTVDKINELGGMNTNKFSAYKSLPMSASDKWVDFKIEECIVVDDMEFIINREVDYINHQTLADKKNGILKSDDWCKIDRKYMDIEIPFTDGLGLSSDRNVGNIIFRAPHIKGLLTYCNMPLFISKYKCNGKIKDIYGKEYDLSDFTSGKIKHIFFKSMFKMAGFYENWQEYIDNFYKYECEACICKSEDKYINKKIKLCYQMLQQLNPVMTNSELLHLTSEIRNDISNLGKDYKTMLKCLGATKDNTKLNDYQKSLIIYPELLKDDYTISTIKDIKASMIKKAKSGKFNLDGVYSFVVPDLVAVCQWLFLGIKDVDELGVIEEDEIYCDVFNAGDVVDCLRSPSLGFEHVVNTVADIEKEHKKFFKTHAIYTSVKSMMCKVLQYDNDGDCLFAVRNKIITDCAIRMKENYKIVPLYYEMEKASPEMINEENLFNGMKDAFKVCIGEWSNTIAKVWDEIDINTPKEKVMEKLIIINIFVMLNNFAIDSAKTKFIPKSTPYIEELLKSYKSNKNLLPHFYIYAKDKKRVKALNNSVVNKLDNVKFIPQGRITFSMDNFKNAEFDYKMMKCNKNYEITEEVKSELIKDYVYMHFNKNNEFGCMEEKDSKESKMEYINRKIRDRLLNIVNDEFVIVDIIIDYLYENNVKYKSTLWDVFGDIILANLINNIEVNTKLCEVCGKRFVIENKNDYCSVYCDGCKSEKDRENARLRKQKQRNRDKK